jgi:hypothetical protein
MENYFKPTPKKWRKIGDTILLGSTSLSAIMMGSPFAENHKSWIIFGLNIFGVVGKLLTNLTTEDDIKQ